MSSIVLSDDDDECTARCHYVYKYSAFSDPDKTIDTVADLVTKGFKVETSFDEVHELDIIDVFEPVFMEPREHDTGTGWGTGEGLCGGYGVGSIATCTDQYGCLGTTTCTSSGWTACTAQEYTVPACIGTASSCSSMSQTNCQSQQTCSWTYTGSSCTNRCSSISSSTTCTNTAGCYWECTERIGDESSRAERAAETKGSVENSLSLSGKAYFAICRCYNSNTCVGLSQSSCQATASCQWVNNYVCSGTAASCQALPSDCTNSLGYVQSGCTTGTRVICGNPPSSNCNSNNKCEQKSNPSAPFYNSSIEENETQDNCPVDCFTYVNINPNIAVSLQEVSLVLTFNDTRYGAGHEVSYNLVIDNVVWNNTNGCPIANKNVKPDANGIGSPCTWTGVSSPCTSTSLDGFMQVRTTCFLPENLSVSSHTLTVIPIFYSEPTQLGQGSTQFVAQSASGTVAETGGGIVLTQAFTTFAIQQAEATVQNLQNFFDWLFSLFR